MDDPISRLTAAFEGRYAIERELGTGGMCTVYLAVDLRYRRQVALKVLRPDLTAAVTGQRFLAEIQTTATLQHPYILPLLDSGEADGILYYAMPYVEGESLRHKLDREGELPVQEALRIAGDLAEALEYAHRQGVVHRDIKPENVLLHGGQPVIADFGIALAIDAAGGNRITGTGQSVGTPHYMSPEQAAASKSVDGRSDVYALGCLLHEMLAGEPVFTGSTPRHVLAKHLTVPPLPIRKLRAAVPRGVEHAIQRALEKSPADRFSTMGDFSVALKRAAPPALSIRGVWDLSIGWILARPILVTAVLLVLIGTGVVVAPFFSGPAWTDRPASVAVLPFTESASTEEEAGLAVEVADAISRELMRWSGVSVATELELAGPRMNMGLTEPTLERSADGAALADAVHSDAMLAITVRERGDSVSVQAALFDARSRRRVGEPVMTSGRVGEARSGRLMAPILATVLGFADAPEPERAFGAGTASPEAAEAYLRGRDALEHNQLDAAEQLLAQAVALDSTFAAALSFLGQVPFWRGVEANYYFLSRGPDISRLSTAAMRYVQSGLSPSSESHVRGFYNLQLGAYDEAREQYGRLVEADSADAYAQMMLGEIELIDPWALWDSAGQLVTRSNLNVARRAFSAAVSLDPTFELAYGQISAIQQQLEKTLNGNAAGFEELEEDARPIWQPRVATERMHPFMLVAIDSLTWIPSAEARRIDRSTLTEGADRYFRRSVGELERWASFAPDQPRPLELLSEAYLRQRAQLGIVAPQRHRSLAEEALHYTSEALALKADTSLADRVRLGNLYLASGDAESAVEQARIVLSERAKAGSNAEFAPQALLNLLVASGQVSAALDFAGQLEVRNGLPARYVLDPAGGEPIAVAGGEHPILDLRILGASGVTGPPVRDRLARLESGWVGEGYSPHQRQVLVNAATTRDILAALAVDSAALAAWRGSVTADNPVWMALALHDVDPRASAEALDRAVRMNGGPDEPVPLFALAVAAAELGRPEEAIGLFSRLDSIPVGVTTFQFAWGLQPLSHFMRAEAYEELGDSSAAALHYRVFIEARSWTDSLSEPLTERARERLARLENS